MWNKFKKHRMVFFIILALCLGAGTSIAQPPEGAKKEEPKEDEGDPTFLYRFSQLLIPNPDVTFKKPNIRNPGPDSANFPNSPYTLPKGMAYFETTPSVAGKGSSNPRIYSTPTLLRYGLTDDVELRLFTNSLTVEYSPNRAGFSPIVFDMKIHFWEENEDLFLPAVGMEILLQSTFGSSFLNTGVQPSMNLLFSKDLVLDTVLEASVGLQSGNIGFTSGDSYEMTVQGDLTTKVTERISLFVQTAYNGSVDPRFANNILVGGGGLLNLTETITIYGSYNASVVKTLPPYFTQLGIAFAF